MAGTSARGPVAGPGLRRGLLAMLRALASTAGLTTIYYLLPLNTSAAPVAVAMLVIGLVGLTFLVSFQVRSILRSPFPGLRAMESLATSVPFFILLFAATYVVLAKIAPGAFSAPLTRSDALYFTVTVFATVGFGDITARSEPARLLVTCQMIADLVVIGLVVNVIVGAAKRRWQA